MHARASKQVTESRCVCLQLHVQDLNTKLACYNPWALQITNCCKSLLLLDTRETEGQTAESSEVIAIKKDSLTQVIPGFPV